MPGVVARVLLRASRAGARVSNMEMMQFHPTCLFNLEVKNFLITEAVRGEGGILKHPETGHRYMPDYDPRAELAPRDVVARRVGAPCGGSGNIVVPCNEARVLEQVSKMVPWTF